MKTLHGLLTIKETNFTSVSFLAGLEALECEDGDVLYIKSNLTMEEVGMTNLTSTSCNIEISGVNKYLGLPNLKNFFIINSTLTFKVYGGSKELCVSVEEFTHFFESDFIEKLSMYPEFCKTNATSIYGEKLCQVDNFNISNFDPTCQRVIGNLVINAGDEEFVHKLKNITWIYGTLVILKTNLTKVDFMDSLQYVASYQSDFINIDIRQNPNLVSVVFPSLKKVMLKINIEEVSPDFVLDPTVCFEFNESLNTTHFRFVLFNDKRCEIHHSFMKSDCSRSHDLVEFYLFLVVIVAHFL